MHKTYIISERKALIVLVPIRDDAKTLNFLGALALRLMDASNTAVTIQAGYGGETAAALVTLGADPGLSINALSQILNLSHPGTVRLIDPLVAAGLVERRAGVDGRTLALFLTDAGYKRRQAILTQRRQQLQLAVSNLTPVEPKQLAKLLEKMLTEMTTSESDNFVICRLCE